MSWRGVARFRWPRRRSGGDAARCVARGGSRTAAVVAFCVGAAVTAMFTATVATVSRPSAGSASEMTFSVCRRDPPSRALGLVDRSPAALRRSPVQVRCAAPVPASTAVDEQKRLKALVAQYRANNSEAAACLALTVVLWAVGLFAIHASGGHWLSLVYMGLVISRCFMVFHDAAHLSFFEDANSNKVLAEFSQYFVNYNWRQWAQIHNSHHAHFGDATVKDTSLTIWYSEDELAAAPWYLRVGHRLIRDPLWFYPVASAFVFFINKPITHAPMRLLVPALVWATLGTKTMLGLLVATWIAGMVGVASFHLQHHCNSAYRVAGPSERTSLDAALAGSTRIPIPFPFSLFSLGIEYHHIHHWDVRVPGYRLARCDADGEKEGLWKGRVNTLGFWRAFKSLWHCQFEGSRKVADEHGNPPRFTTFWPYSALRLQDA